MSRSPTAARSVGSQSWCDTRPLTIFPAGKRPGQRAKVGTLHPPSQLVFFSLLKGVMPPSGQELKCGPLSVE